ncbi:MAG: hypothetical protein H6Q89_548 [Myxococcaceae bacterium]|nr:hypothetical protein [Myxococcaceae bacterium]
MRVAVEIVLEDIHAFNRHYATTAALPRRNQQLVRLALTLTLACLLGALGMAIRAPVPFWILGVLILLAWWKVYPRRIEALSRQSTRRLYSDGKNLGMLGPHVVSFDDEWLCELTSEREVRTRWRAVEKSALTAEHLFLYVSGFAAVIVPLRAFPTEAERTAFVEEAQRRVLRPATTRPDEPPLSAAADRASRGP